ncbi:MAG TPA: hypothetical protein VKP69_02140 [Isosphaeraceae bacterium]|nr:hypothetical protein [Isosphaeraceae bacterium]
MSDEVDLQETRRWLVPVRERPDRNLPAGFGRWLSLLASPRGSADRRQESIDGCRTGREQELPDGRIERQMAVPFHGGDQTGQDGPGTFPTDPVGCFPENDECFTDRLGIDPPPGVGCIVDEGAGSSEQSNGMLAMAAGEGNEFIQDFRFIDFC